MIADGERHRPLAARAAAATAVLCLEPLLIGSAHASALCGLSRRSWQQLVTTGHVPPPLVVLAGKRLWSIESLRSWILDGAPPASQTASRPARRPSRPRGDGRAENDQSTAGKEVPSRVGRPGRK